MSSKESRFDSLFSAARVNQQEQMSKCSDIQESKSLDVQTSTPKNDSPEHIDVQTSKSKNPAYQRTTVYLPKDLHKKFKVTAMNEETEMSDIMIELIEQWLNSKITL